MLKRISLKVSSFVDGLKIVFTQFKTQSAYEIRNVFVCQKTGKQIVEVKITGKSNSIVCSAAEIAEDDSFIGCFSPLDIRTITYLATCDQYEIFLQKEKMRNPYEIIRSKKNNHGDKTIKLRHKETNEYRVVSVADFVDQNLINDLSSQDAYYLGYLAGQEQSWKDCVRLKLISRVDRNFSDE